MLTVEEFMTHPRGYNNWYAEYTLIGKGVTPQSVVDVLNEIGRENADFDVEYAMAGTIKRNSNGYSKVCFTIDKGDTDLIYECSRRLHCVGYAEIPWYDELPFCVKNGKDYNDGFTAKWDIDMPLNREEEDENGARYWDCFIIITDKTSGISFQDGHGAVSTKTMCEIENFIVSHCA